MTKGTLFSFVVVVGFLIGIGVGVFTPQPVSAEGPPDKPCICVSMAYCLDPAPGDCGCPENWAVITYDKSEFDTELGHCNGEVCEFAICGDGAGCVEDCLPQ